MSSPKISIVSPSFNQGEFIEDAIQSVIQQNYPNFEHIIIDGGSNDNTLSILKKYPHLIWISEKDEGQSDAINKGFNLATGDIIGWLNTDDYYSNGTFSTISKVFENDTTDVVYGDIQSVYKDKQINRIVKSHRPVKWLSLFHCYIHSATVFFRRQILDDGIRIDPKIHICMDKDLFANILYHGYKFKYLSKVLTSFRWHENNKSLDTPQVQKTSAYEGLTIFSRYSKIQIKPTKINKTIYRNFCLALRVLRPFLR